MTRFDAADTPWWARFRVLVALSVLEAAAIVPFHYFPSEDGPTNVASAHIIASYPGPYRPYLTLDFTPKFDLLWQLLLSLPARVVPGVFAERVMLVLLIVALPVAGWYAARGVRDGGGPAAFLLLPLAIGFFLHAGYHSFCLGVVLFLVTIGWWLRHRDGGTRPTVVLAALLVLTYLAHVVAAAMAIGVITMLVAWDTVATRDRRELRRLLPIAVAAVPVGALVVTYLARSSGTSGIGRLDVKTLVKDALTLRPALASMDGREQVLSTLFALGVAALAVACIAGIVRKPLVARANAWLAAVVATGLVYFVAPNEIGNGGQINERLLSFVLAVMVLWLSTFALRRRALLFVVALSVCTGLGLTVLHVAKYAAFDRDIRELTSAGRVLHDGDTIVPVYLVEPTDAHPGLAQSKWTHPTTQATGYLVDEHDVVDLSHFNGEFDYFITQFRRSVDPFELIAGGRNWLADQPPSIDITGYETKTGGKGRIDVVFVWGDDVAPASVKAAPGYQSLQAQLARSYQLVYTSSRGHLQVYRRRP